MFLYSCDHVVEECELEPEFNNVKVLSPGEELHTRDNVRYRKAGDFPFSGKEIERYDSCQIGILATYEDGSVSKIEEWFEDGKRQSEVHFKVGTERIENHGVWTYWYENGQKEAQANWTDNLKHGLDIVWYGNGTKAYEVNYVYGQKQGLEIKWHRNGSKNTQVSYMNGEPTGMVQIWDEDGEILEEKRLK